MFLLEKEVDRNTKKIMSTNFNIIIIPSRCIQLLVYRELEPGVQRATHISSEH